MLLALFLNMLIPYDAPETIEEVNKTVNDVTTDDESSVKPGLEADKQPTPAEMQV